jgi:hypothetical protein
MGDLGHPIQDQLFCWTRFGSVTVDRGPFVQNGAGAPFTDPVARPEVIDQDAALGFRALAQFFRDALDRAL